MYAWCDDAEAAAEQPIKTLLHVNQYASSVEDPVGSWVLLGKRVTKRGGKAKVTESQHELSKKVNGWSKEERDAMRAALEEASQD